eukprot:TRINITY_DN5634_c0_g1_i1.p1 TRINITY_DN5634_c0_g1~~TRINITY_DN5634_c0_g1_i1.p1  ORF type:complete len:321 (+),score=71.37 TRINITY_DN5634_c0_g1_i1:46-1008(+)
MLDFIRNHKWAYDSGAWQIFLRITIPCWFIQIPLCVFLRIVTWPLWLAGKFVGKAPKVVSEYSVVVKGPEEDKALDTILLVHGWPDDASLWDKQVPVLVKEGYRCLVVTAPGFGVGETTSGFGISHEEMGLKLKKVVDENTKGKKVTLMLHDWGCLWGYNFQKACPDMVKRIIALDIGGIQEPDFALKLFFITYQTYNVVAYILGGRIGDVMNKLFLHLGKYHARPIDQCKSSLNFPYFHMQKKVWTLSYQQNLNPHKSVPLAYGHGLHKPVPFHGPTWIKELNETKNCEVKAFECDHWIPTNQPDELNAWALQWLKKTN